MVARTTAATARLRATGKVRLGMASKCVDMHLEVDLFAVVKQENKNCPTLEISCDGESHKFSP
ncbi:hypothetical protein ACN9M1_15640 [Ralstonia sp. R-29]|uniref:hypothetical protein n=1 Tax=Ralstonia sp. R-29 TaxID=3404059 RepID=UPI003CEC5450